jgi:hypothetical protein
MDLGELPTPSCPTWTPVTSSRPAAVHAARTRVNEQDEAHEKVVLLFLLPMPYSGEHDKHCNSFTPGISTVFVV